MTNADKQRFRILAAPVQGHTDAAWRHFHSEVYGGAEEYYTPFIRLEHGEFRRHDLKDYTSELNANHRVVPQVIFRDLEELHPLVEGLVSLGAKRIDLNTGCPFPLQTARGRGAAFIANIGEYEKLPALIDEFPDTEFSLKMRLGAEDAGEWRGVAQIISGMRLSHVTMHPRVARQQYKGDPDLGQFGEFAAVAGHPVIYNGDLNTPADISRIRERFPSVAGVMTGRGLLGRPSLIAEAIEGRERSLEERLEDMLRFHRLLLEHYETTLCGDSQILSKIKPFWEYAEPEIGRKAWKQIRKSTNMAKYHSAVASILRD